VSGEVLSLVEVAQALGVHYMTAYRYVRLGQLPATKIGSVWQVDRCDLDRYLERGSTVTSPRRRADWASRIEARLLGGDQAGAWAVIEAALTGGIEPVEVYTEALGPALRSIGERWAKGDVDPGQEHLATAIAHRLIGRLGPRFAHRGRTRGSVVLAMPPNDRHGLGIAMVGDVFLGAGFEPIELGADVPLASLESAIHRVDRLKAVGIGAVVSNNRKHLAAAVRRARRAAGPGIPIILGGPGTNGEEAIGLRADGWAATATDGVDMLERCLRGEEVGVRSVAATTTA
jgi:MerR family transcriptional regulator, light-induced transcriptional regulator